MSGFGIEVRSDAITEAKRRERFRNVEKMLLQNEKAFLRAKIALTMPKSNNPLPVLPTEIRDKIMASTQYENIPVETSQKILKELGTAYQSAFFRHSIAMLLQNLFMTSTPGF